MFSRNLRHQDKNLHNHITKLNDRRGVRWQIPIEDIHLAMIERIEEGVGEKFQVIELSIKLKPTLP